MTLKCPKCGIDLPSNSSFCPRDGTTVREDTVALTTSAILAIGPAPPPMPVVSSPVAAPAIAAAVDPLLGRVIDGRYAIVRQLGKGAVGAVYEAEQVGLKKAVAVKVLNAAMAQTEEFRKRFEREAHSASRLSHPGCVSVLDFGSVSRVEPLVGGEQLVGVPYLVMEMVRGELLLDRIEKGKLPAAEAIVITRSLLSALRHAHGLEIVHRDVKPANIMLSPSGETAPLVKLLDFGLAKSVAQDSPDAPLTQMGMVFGTPGYLSPEQASARPVDARSDLYSLGVTLFEMVCGRPPFVADNAVDVVRDHLVTTPPSPRDFTPSLSTEIEAVILKALAKDPNDRFQTADSFQAALAACPEASPARVAAPVPSASAAARPRARADAAWAALSQLVRRHRRIFVATVAGLSALVVAAVVVSRARSSPPPVPPAPAPSSATAPLLVSASGRRHLRQAAEYQEKLWCADAIEELERALREEPGLRADPALTRTAIPCLRAKTQAKTIEFLVEKIGSDARPELEAALVGDLKADVREGAERVLARLSRAP